MDVESSLVLFILGGHLGVPPLVSEETDVSLPPLDGAFELVDSGSSGGEEFFRSGCTLTDGVHQSPGDGAGGLTNVRIVGDAEDGSGCSW